MSVKFRLFFKSLLSSRSYRRLFTKFTLLLANWQSESLGCGLHTWYMQKLEGTVEIKHQIWHSNATKYHTSQ